jgi:trigger factor
MSENTVSKSRAKRDARRKENQKLKREAARNKIIGIAVVVVICAVFVAGIISAVYTRMTQTTASSDYSAMLNDDGTVKNVNPTDYIEPLDYQNISVAYSDIAYTDEDMASEITSVLNNYKTAETDSSLTAADGDTLNIDYVGTIDGVAFDGGDTEGNGTDLTLGSGSYVDDFEDQLIGSHPGDTVEVEVTFPEDYSSEELQGKDAVFEVVVNSIYVVPELTDEFVAENLSDYGSTVDEYKAYLRETNEADNLNDYLETYIEDNAVSNSYNKAYIKYLRQIGKYEQESYYESYNQMYLSLIGSAAFSSFEDYTGMTDKEFEAYLKESAQSRATLDLTYQYIFTDAGLSISDEDYENEIADMDSSSVESYGKAYIMQQMMQEKVIAYLAENVAITE